MGAIRHTGRPWRRLRAKVLAESDLCWLCAHPGATTVDLIIPLSRGGDPLDPANLRPAHGVQGCPICGRKCNSSRGNRMTGPRTRNSRAW